MTEKIFFTHHNRPFDGWSLIHFLSGAGLGVVALFFGGSFEVSTIVSLVILIGWEFVESFTGIGEPLPNVITDIVLGIVGFFIAWYLFFGTSLETEIRAFFIIILMQGLLLSMAYFFRRSR